MRERVKRSERREEGWFLEKIYRNCLRVRKEIMGKADMFWIRMHSWMHFEMM